MDKKTEQSTHPLRNSNTGIASNSRQLQHYFATVSRYLKKTRRFNLKKHPWIWLIGDLAAGKTSLLAHSGLNLSSPTRKSLHNTNQTQFIDWWVCDTAVFVDLAGQYALPELDNAIAQNIWMQLLTMSKRYHGQHPVDHLILVVDFPALCQSKSEIVTLAERFSHQLRSIQSMNKPLTITLMVSKCDLILGFREFFADLDASSREQKLGFYLPKSTDAVVTLFQQRFNELVKRIGSQLIDRLHHELNIDKRCLIKDFPLQLEQLGAVLANLINELPLDDNSHLNGVFFTSSLQEDNPLNIAAQSIANTTSIAVPTQSTAIKQSQPFFLTQLFRQLATKAGVHLIKRPIKALRSKIVLCVVVLVLIALGVFLHFSYRAAIFDLNQMQTKLTTATQKTTTTEKQWTTKLDALEDASNSLKRQKKKIHRWAGSAAAKRLQKTIQKNYRQMLLNIFLPDLKETLESQIQHHLNQDQLSLYNALKAYLMLTNPKRLDAAYLKNWFSEIWQKKYPLNTQQQQSLQKYLTILLQYKNISIKANTSLITNARKSLKKLPLADRIFVELQGYYPSQNVSLLTKKTDLPLFNLDQMTIPQFYASDHFNVIYSQQIPRLTSKLARGDWVTGKISEAQLSASDLKRLIQEVQTLYTVYYAKKWLTMLPKITLDRTKNLDDIQTVVNQLITPNSKLQNALKYLLNNAAAKGKISEADLAKNKNYQSINGYLNKKGVYLNIQAALQNLSEYLKKISQSKNKTKTAYHVTLDRFSNKGANDPISILLKEAQHSTEPLQSWLTAIAGSSWSAILAQSKQYLNDTWQQHVMKEYNQNIKDHYPIFKKSRQQMSLKAFAHFFQPNGTIDAFFTFYIEPFVNMKGYYWTWKTLNGQSIGFDQKTLNMLIRASVIQQMFFTDNPDKPGFKFSLTPENLSTSSDSFVLNLEGQLVIYNAASTSQQNLRWPGPKPGVVAIQFHSANKKSPSLRLHGPWAWFLLLDRSELKPSQDPRQYQLIFHLNKQRARFQLIANNRVNPFVSNILGQFRCPKKL